MLLSWALCVTFLALRGLRKPLKESVLTGVVLLELCLPCFGRFLLDAGAGNTWCVQCVANKEEVVSEKQMPQWTAPAFCPSFLSPQ